VRKRLIPLDGTESRLTSVYKAVVSEKISHARVHWQYLGEDGRLLIAPTYEYLIRADRTGPRIHVVVSACAEQQIAALLAPHA
jgi:hypothetical protein